MSILWIWFIDEQKGISEWDAPLEFFLNLKQTLGKNEEKIHVNFQTPAPS